MNIDNISSLKGFTIVEVLNEQPENKTIFLHGKFDNNDESLVLIIERLHFPNDVKCLEDGIRRLTSIVKKEANDIYGFYEATLPESLNGLKATFVYPATEKHLQKYRKKKYHLILESPEYYHKVTLPHIEESKFSIQWVYNILNHTKEADRIIFEDPNPDTGFVLLPDAKWDGKTVSSLYLIAIVHKKGLKSIRSLNPDHLPLLENIRGKSKEILKKKFNITPSQIRIYFHYQPSYYHLHAHVTFLQYSPPGINTEKSHMIDTVINNIKLIPDYYSKGTLPFVVAEEDQLFQKYKDSGHPDLSENVN
ncbi:m7GpppX diphosphatase-like isoform X2 [Artemia franciscana]|uniref:m7GpppX diphosphatase-like isoform X2 n=1 Tax=Artemia franciscana TaxID=6661 RepID=UPI0032DB81ED